MVNGEWQIAFERRPGLAVAAQVGQRSNTIHHLPFTIYRLLPFDLPAAHLA
jgi:hypothetical protein